MPQIKDNAAIALADSAVQTCAYELYELRGRIDGRAEQDWYQADRSESQQQTSVADTNVRRNFSKALRELALPKTGVVLWFASSWTNWNGTLFRQGRQSRDIDSLGWTDREFSCLDAILNHKREGHQGESCPGD